MSEHIERILGEPRPLTAIATATLGRVPELASVFLAQVGEITGYADGLIESDELRASAERSIELLIGRIARTVSEGEIVAFSTSIGRSRMDAGVPLDSLMQAVRLDFRLVWGALSDEIRPNEMPALVDGGSDVWEAVERHASATLSGYQAREAEISRAREEEQKSWLARLVETRGARPELVRRAAQILGVGVDRRFVAVAAPSGALADTQAELTELGVVTHPFRAAEGEVLLVQLPVGVDERWADWFAGVGCVVSNVSEGLAAVPRQLLLALACLDALGAPTEPRTVSSSWFELAVHRLGDYRPDIATDVLHPLSALPEAEAERLREAVTIYLETGSPSATAEALFCHRNTVSNRLQRFRDVVGLDPTNPKDSALIRLALLSVSQ